MAFPKKLFPWETGLPNKPPLLTAGFSYSLLLFMSFSFPKISEFVSFKSPCAKNPLFLFNYFYGSLVVSPYLLPNGRASFVILSASFDSLFSFVKSWVDLWDGIGSDYFSFDDIFDESSSFDVIFLYGGALKFVSFGVGIFGISIGGRLAISLFSLSS